MKSGFVAGTTGWPTMSFINKVLLRSPSLVELQWVERGSSAFSTQSCPTWSKGVSVGNGHFFSVLVSNWEGASVYLCLRNEKTCSLFVKKCLGGKKSKRNERVIPASWTFPYSDGFVAPDSGPWLSALQLHLPEMQTGFICGFWVCWLVRLGFWGFFLENQ